jgi:hypothetical protein
MVLVVDDLPVPPPGEPADVLPGGAHDDLADDLLALAAHDPVDVRAAVEQVLDLLRRLVAPDDRGDLRGNCDTKSQTSSKRASHRMLMHSRSIPLRMNALSRLGSWYAFS